MLIQDNLAIVKYLHWCGSIPCSWVTHTMSAVSIRSTLHNQGTFTRSTVFSRKFCGLPHSKYIHRINLRYWKMHSLLSFQIEATGQYDFYIYICTGNDLTKFHRPQVISFSITQQKMSTPSSMNIYYTRFACQWDLNGKKHYFHFK